MIFSGFDDRGVSRPEFGNWIPELEKRDVAEREFVPAEQRYRRSNVAAVQR